MMKHLLLCLALLFLLSNPAQAEDARPDVLVVGAGSKSCSFLLENTQNPVGELLVAWVQGSLSGMDAAIVNATGKEGIYKKFDSMDMTNSLLIVICKHNPDMTLSDAANALYLVINGQTAH